MIKIRNKVGNNSFLGLWLDFSFTNFLDFNCDGYTTMELYRRARV
jgi:hypothetical protein